MLDPWQQPPAEPVLKNLRLIVATPSEASFVWDVANPQLLERQHFWSWSWLDGPRFGSELPAEARSITVQALRPSTEYLFTLAGTWQGGRLLREHLYMQIRTAPMIGPLLAQPTALQAAGRYE